MNVVRKELKLRWQLYVMLLLPVTHLIIFAYIPMAGIVIAFNDFSIRAGIWGSEWVGFRHFVTFFNTPDFSRLLENTLILSFYGLFVGFPIPILLALAINELRGRLFKRAVQMITYAPYFISVVVLVGMMMTIFSVRTGFVNNIISFVGGERIDFMGQVHLFRHMYVWAGVWQAMGFSAVIYIAALSNVDPSLTEAAVSDGAGRIFCILNVDLPAIMPTIIIQLILAMGFIMSIGFDRAYLMQNPINLQVSEIIPTFVYKRGLLNFQYSYAAAVGLFNSVVNLALLLTANAFARKFNETSLF